MTASDGLSIALGTLAGLALLATIAPILDELLSAALISKDEYEAKRTAILDAI